MAEPNFGEPAQIGFDEKIDLKTGIAVAKVDEAPVEHQPITAPADGNAGKPEFGDIAALAGRGAVVVKAVAEGHDFRFDIPTVGPATIAAMAKKCT